MQDLMSKILIVKEENLKLAELMERDAMVAKENVEADPFHPDIIIV